MAGSAFSNWWTLVRPYYTKAYQEMWVGIGLMSVLYYKISYGGELKASQDVFSLSALCNKNQMSCVAVEV